MTIPRLSCSKIFARAFGAFANERDLNSAQLSLLRRMYAGGDAILFVARKDGEVTNYLHLYRSARAGIFMYGVNLTKENDGVGQFLHWEIMRRLKRDGLRWYDFGGVATLNPSDGIFNFKRKFGARLAPLGSEWRYTGASFRALATGGDLLRAARNRRFLR